MGIPTVASDIGHYSATIPHGKEAFLVKGNDPDLWMQYLTSLIEMPGLREEIGRSAYKRVKKDFNVRRNAPKYLRLLKSLSNSTVEDREMEEVA